ncbi:MAG: hypothetical protein GF353_21920 [Candidatus Lokiarchaeota archaeon]|nr:hypothetical protein [Candidatus Lokiarchaeota archaeon]
MEKEIVTQEIPQKTKKGTNYWEMALEAVVAATPVIGPPAAAILRASKGSKKASESNDLQKLAEEASRQRLELQMAEMQARVAQEMAIAQRIQTAQEVEIEEYYEGTREGNAGVNLGESTLNVGLSGKGSKVTKRVYRFKGQRDSNIEIKK